MRFADRPGDGQGFKTRPGEPGQLKNSTALAGQNHTVATDTHYLMSLTEP